jgi:hypothetical protein
MLKLAREHVQDLHEKGQREDKRVEKEEREVEREWLGDEITIRIVIYAQHRID